VPIRTLIVDDDAPFTASLERLLAADERIEVVGCAHDGHAAIRLARELRPDLILMDALMPVIDGVGAARRIRKAWPEAKIAMLTGSDVEADANRAREVGAVAYFRKDHLAELPDAVCAL